MRKFTQSNQKTLNFFKMTVINFCFSRVRPLHFYSRLLKERSIPLQQCCALPLFLYSDNLFTLYTTLISSFPISILFTTHLIISRLPCQSNLSSVNCNQLLTHLGQKNLRILQNKYLKTSNKGER